MSLNDSSLLMSLYLALFVKPFNSEFSDFLEFLFYSPPTKLQTLTEVGVDRGGWRSGIVRQDDIV